LGITACDLRFYLHISVAAPAVFVLLMVGIVHGDLRRSREVRYAKRTSLSSS
jgi:hypothetical protein